MCVCVVENVCGGGGGRGDAGQVGQEVQSPHTDREMRAFVVAAEHHRVIVLPFQTGPFMLQSPPMSTFHQQLWLTAHIDTDSKEGRSDIVTDSKEGRSHVVPDSKEGSSHIDTDSKEGSLA